MAFVSNPKTELEYERDLLRKRKEISNRNKNRKIMSVQPNLDVLAVLTELGMRYDPKDKSYAAPGTDAGEQSAWVAEAIECLCSRGLAPMEWMQRQDFRRKTFLGIVNVLANPQAMSDAEALLISAISGARAEYCGVVSIEAIISYDVGVTDDRYGPESVCSWYSIPYKGQYHNVYDYTIDEAVYFRSILSNSDSGKDKYTTLSAHRSSCSKIATCIDWVVELHMTGYTFVRLSDERCNNPVLWALVTTQRDSKNWPMW